MKKQLLLVGSLAILMASCGTQTAEKVQEEVKVYSIADLLSGAEALVDDTVWFSGNVKKVCCSKKKMMVARVKNTHRGALFFKKLLILSFVSLSIE